MGVIYPLARGLPPGATTDPLEKDDNFANDAG
jgi:hypothetical protein